MPKPTKVPKNADPVPTRAARIGLSLVLGVPFLLVSVAFVIGSRSPAERHLERSIRVARPLTEVHALLADLPRQPSWWREVERIEPLSADGMVRQVFRNERTAHLLVEPTSEPDTVVWRIRDPAGPYRGTWRFDLVPAAEGVEVTLRENAQLGNPFARFLVAIAGGGGALVDGCLNDLAAWALADGTPAQQADG